MQDALRHRGPDGEGVFSNPFLCMAMRRLSIIDVAGGRQPLYNEDRSLVLVANGEIYNFVELRSKLENRGHRFQTRSDCENILHLYEDHGADCVKHLRGMFAFALWDNSRRRLLLARDRMGEKPLYLFEADGMIAFSSELKALLSSGVVGFELDPESIDLYFHYQYVPEPRTPLKGVRKLDAACLLQIDIDSWRAVEKCYWRMEDAPPLEGDPAECIRAELETVSEMVIRSDVPVGVALSGGLDSSAIAALASRKYPGRMHAFSVGYPNRPRNDERADAKAFADHLEMPFHDIELADSDMAAFFPELVYWRDDPIADISGFGYYAVMKLARDHGVPVILQGQGGDELFWGYQWVRQAVDETFRKAALLEGGWTSLPSYLRIKRPLSLGPRSLLNWAADGFGMRSGWACFQYHRSCPPDQLIFYDVVPDFRSTLSDMREFYTPALAEQLNDRSAAAGLFTFGRPWPRIDVRMTRLICDTYLRENGIVQGDRLSMASSVELRLPLLDYRLVETVIGLRKNQRDDQLPSKSWFKAALEGIVPAWVMNRPKQGFAPPVHQWYKALFEAYGEQLDGGYLVQNGILSAAGARQLSRGICPPGIVTPLSFKALVLEIWCRKMFNSKLSPPAD